LLTFSYATTPDYDFVTDRMAVGGSIFTRENFEALMRAGFTHIINTQIEFDDTTLLRGGDHEPAVFWLPTDDDFLPKPSEFFFQGVRYGLEVLDQPEGKLLIHCASGIHRGPLLALALLRVLGYERHDALRLLRARRPQADFPGVYLDSVEAFLAEWEVEKPTF
jgi:protein-tyrosine phosphatase